MDKPTPERRSANKARIRSKNAKPELTVRRFLHARGLRCRLPRGDLPGKPVQYTVVKQTASCMPDCFPSSMLSVPPRCTSSAMAANEPIVVFDTDCLLCSRMVAFVLVHERGAPVLRFVGAWSPEGWRSPSGTASPARTSTAHFRWCAEWRLVRGMEVLTRSDAGVAVLRHLRPPWRWLAPVLAALPRRLRDAGYALVAQHRHRWLAGAPIAPWSRPASSTASLVSAARQLRPECDFNRCGRGAD